MTAFRLLTMDLLELFKVMNEGTINVLEHYFEMSKVDAQRALNIYKTFGRQTDMVVAYLSTARQYQAYTKLEVPKLKHAPTTLTSSLEDYLNDPDFEVNRRQYLAQQEAKRTGKPVQAPASSSKPAAKAAPSTAVATQPAAPPPAKGPAPDLIDFFESIEQNQQPMVQQVYAPDPQMGQVFPEAQTYQQPQIMPQQTSYNPFMQNFGQQPQQQPPPPQPQPQALQTDFTGAGFGGYGPQPQQPQPYTFNSHLSSIPQNNMADFPQQQQIASPQQLQSPQSLQPQPTGTNPFRQSMLSPTGAGSSSPFTNTTPLNRSSTNPFAKHNTNTFQQQASPPPVILENQQSSFQPQSQPFSSPIQSQPQSQLPPTAAPLTSQRTGTNPFAKNLSPPPQPNTLPVHVTGSTNPFRQSQFVNQQTGQGWQHSNQGTFSGFDINGVQTTSVFPRPGAQHS